MTGAQQNLEKTIRVWLAESVPQSAPVSLRETLEAVTSTRPGRAEPWPGSDRGRLRLAARVAAGIAIIALAGSGMYLLGSPYKAGPAASTSAPSGGRPDTSVTAIAWQDSGWTLVPDALPQMAGPTADIGSGIVFAISSGGFAAFVPVATAQTGTPTYRACSTTYADPPPSVDLGAGLIYCSTRPTASSPAWIMHVYRSNDGANWAETGQLPGDQSTVRSLATMGGQTVVVGMAGTDMEAGPVAWSTRDFQTWTISKLPGSLPQVLSVAAGPAGYVASGDGDYGDVLGGTIQVGDVRSRIWRSANGVDWQVVTTSGLVGPALRLCATADGYAAQEVTADHETIVTSADGVTWSAAWEAQSSVLTESSFLMGYVVKAPTGGYVSFAASTRDSGKPGDPPQLALWISEDRVHWTMADRVNRPGWSYDFAAGASGYVAAGHVKQVGFMELGEIDIWTSADGRAWQRTPIPSVGAVRIVSVVGDGAHVVITFADAQGDLGVIVGRGAPNP